MSVQARLLQRGENKHTIYPQNELGSGTSMILLSIITGGHHAPPHWKSTEQCHEEKFHRERKNTGNLNWKTLIITNGGSQSALSLTSMNKWH